MSPTVKAILAKYDGDVKEAVFYCLNIAANYPHLWVEYMAIAEQLVA